MRLYHGTNAKHIDEILKEGLLPGDQVGRSNWDEYPARPGMVYLSDSLPWRFALCSGSSEDVIEYGLAIVEAKVGDGRLVPDEDYLGQLWASEEKTTLSEATQRADVNAMRLHRHLWKTSLERIGTVAHEGPIRVKQITRIVVLNPQIVPVILALEKAERYVPRLRTYPLVAEQARSITRWFMGESRELADVFVFRSVDGTEIEVTLEMPSQARRVIELSGGRVIGHRVA